MKHETFLDILNEVDETLLTRCDTDRRPIAKRFWKPLTAIAAVLAVTIIGVGARSFIFATDGAGAGGSGRDNGLEYMDYIGPVLPLTALDDPAGLEAQRHIDYNFSPYLSNGDSYYAAAQITDSYTLTNTTDQDQTVTLAYPYSGRLLDRADRLLQIIADNRQNFKRSWIFDPASETLIADAAISDVQYLGLAAELLTTVGILSENAAERYQVGSLNDIFLDVLSNRRLLYLTFEITIPAGESITVEGAMLRSPHQDVHGRANRGHGYDMATTLGSSLRFTEQKASVSNTDAIRIVSRNFGFKPAKGITEVTLDPNAAHYWMEIRRVRLE